METKITASAIQASIHGENRYVRSRCNRKNPEVEHGDEDHSVGYTSYYSRRKPIRTPHDSACIVRLRVPARLLIKAFPPKKWFGRYICVPTASKGTPNEESTHIPAHRTLQSRRGALDEENRCMLRGWRARNTRTQIMDTHMR